MILIHDINLRRYGQDETLYALVKRNLETAESKLKSKLKLQYLVRKFMKKNPTFHVQLEKVMVRVIRLYSIEYSRYNQLVLIE